MNNKALAGFIILIVGVGVLVFFNRGTVQNQRVDQGVKTTTASRLKDLSTENLETLSEPLTELKTETVLPTNSDSLLEVKDGDIVTVNYKGWLATTGEIFDQSFNRGDAGFTFTIGGAVIQGWSDGIQGMKLGEVRRLKIPYELGYGEAGNPPSIPERTDLIFDVELLEIKQ